MKAINPEVITEMEEIKKNAIATMSNQIVEARYRLTIEEQRIFLALISLVEPSDEDFKDYKIPVSVLKELTGTKRKDIYTAVKEAVERLLKRTIVIETENDFEAFNFISYGKYKKGEGCFVISIDKHLKPYLLQLKEKFTRIPLKYVFPLSSKYAIRLYELLKQYEGTGFRVDYLKDLREKLGVEEHEYKAFKDFEKRVLKTAIREINEKTDIQVSYTKKKTRKRISHIEFKIKTKKSKKKSDTTQKTKSTSESVDTQRQKKQQNFNLEDLWRNVLKILEQRFKAHEADVDFLKEYTEIKYNAKAKPKQMIIKIRGENEIVKRILEKYKKQIDEIVRIETMKSYVVVIEN